MNRIIINGKVIETDGKSISVSGNSIIIDGMTIQDGLSGIVEIKFEGDLASLTVQRGSAEVKGNIKGRADIGGSLTCKGNIEGHVS